MRVTGREFRFEVAEPSGVFRPQGGDFRRTGIAEKEWPFARCAPLRILLQRLFIDAGALCWPSGLELSPARL